MPRRLETQADGSVMEYLLSWVTTMGGRPVLVHAPEYARREIGPVWTTRCKDGLINPGGIPTSGNAVG